MKTKEKESLLPDDPTAEICAECRRKTVELTLQIVGIPTDATGNVIEKVEILEHGRKYWRPSGQGLLAAVSTQLRSLVSN